MTINAVQSTVNLARFGLGQTDSFVGSGVFQRIEYVRDADGAITKIEKKPAASTQKAATRKYKAAAVGKKTLALSAPAPVLRRRLAAATAASPTTAAPKSTKLYW